MTPHEMADELKKRAEADPTFTYAIVILHEDAGEVISNICCLTHLCDAIAQIDQFGTKDDTPTATH